MAEFKAAFFDLDGTLADNYTAIWKTVGAVFKERGLEAPSYDKVYRSVGGSILLTLEKLLPEGEKAAALDMGRRYMELCPLFVYDGLKPMPHARGILEALAKMGIKTACFTNKQTEAAEAVLEKDGGHPTQLAAWGFLPASSAVDSTVMKNTLRYVLDRWDWNRDTWGWDFPLMAMTAVRLNKPEWALEALAKAEWDPTTAKQVSIPSPTIRVL